MVGSWPVAKALLVGGGAVAVVAGFMPWVVLRLPLFGQISIAGSEGDGRFTAAGGALVAVVALLRSTGRVGRALLGIVGALVVLTATYDMSQVGNADARGLASIGLGLYLTLAAGLAMLAGAAMGEPSAPEDPANG